MSGKKKIEEDYKRFEDAVEQMAQEELCKIREKATLASVEAEKIGKSVEQDFNETKASGKKKKS